MHADFALALAAQLPGKKLLQRPIEFSAQPDVDNRHVRTSGDRTFCQNYALYVEIVKRVSALFSDLTFGAGSAEMDGMKKLVRKGLQVLEAYDEALGTANHGQQQEIVNAALTMYFVAPTARKRQYTRIFRAIRDGEVRVAIEPRLQTAVFTVVTFEGDEQRIRQLETLFAAPGHEIDEADTETATGAADAVERAESEAHRREKKRSHRKTERKKAK